MNFCKGMKWMVLAISIAFLAVTPCQASHHTVANPFSGKFRLSSVAWSPDGGQIAFVATPKFKTGDEEMIGPKESSIWLVSVARDGQLGRARLVFEQTLAKEGIPVALFWLSSYELGWASQKKGYFVMLARRISGRETRNILGCGIRLVQSRAYGGRYAPDDVYYDPKSYTLLFTGMIDGSFQDPNNLVISYDTKTHLLSTSALGTNVHEYVTLCAKHGESVFYLAGAGPNNQNLLWKTDYMFRQSIVIRTSQKELMFFPRLSPENKSLSWIETVSTNQSIDVLFSYDLATKRKHKIANLSSDWEGTNPAMGCPYSWSPNGREIAYADGPIIRIVKTGRQ